MQYIQCFFYEIQGGQYKNTLEFSTQPCIPGISEQSTDNRWPFHNIQAIAKHSCAHCTDGEERTSERAHKLHKVLSDSVLQLVAPG